MPRTSTDSQRDPAEIHADRSAAARDEYGARTSATLEAPPPGLHGPSVGNAFLNNHAGLGADSSGLAAQETDPDLMGTDAELNLLEDVRRENIDLRQRTEDLEELAAETLRKEQIRDEQQKELESLLEEKSDVIRELHQKLQEFQGKPVAATPREEELLALHEELEQERRQLKEDEEALMQQMRQMEVQMSRERAEMARQRSELQRLHNDIRHELELAAREAELRDRLQPLQRRHQEMVHRKGGEPRRDTSPAPTPASANGNGDHKSDKPGEGGIFRRLFG